jgi:hypothetical protein
MPLRIPRVVLRAGPGPTWTSGKPRISLIEDVADWAIYVDTRVESL